MGAPFPIVLAHGVCRFDVLWKHDNCESPGRDQFHYFRGVRTMLREKGFTAFHANVPWAGAVGERAEALRGELLRILEETGADKVNLIAHSMGGLDARHMMFGDREAGRIHERLASVSTIGTPHEGSPFADWGLKHFEKLVPLCKRLGLDLRGIEDLTTVAAKRFHDDPEVVAFEDGLRGTIAFRSFAGRQGWWGIGGALRGSYSVVKRAEGDNDGVVSVQSARWRPEFFSGVLENTDHFNELGWWDAFQLFALEGPRALKRRIWRFYAELAAALP